MFTCVLLQMERKSSQRGLPLRLSCVATGSRRIAKCFNFGEAVTADLITLHQCVLSDGNNLHLLTLPAGRQDMLIPNQAYVFKNLVLREGKAFFNDNSAYFRSYPMTIRPELVTKASQMLLPPSPPVKIKDTRDTPHSYFTVEGQVIYVSISARGQWANSGTPQNRILVWRWFCDDLSSNAIQSTDHT